MDRSQSKSNATTKDLGLRCAQCGHQQFKVIYTRLGADESIVRRRACLKCRFRFTTRERPESD